MKNIPLFSKDPIKESFLAVIFSAASFLVVIFLGALNILGERLFRLRLIPWVSHLFFIACLIIALIFYVRAVTIIVLKRFKNRIISFLFIFLLIIPLILISPVFFVFNTLASPLRTFSVTGVSGEAYFAIIEADFPEGCALFLYRRYGPFLHYEAHSFRIDAYDDESLNGHVLYDPLQIDHVPDNSHALYIFNAHEKKIVPYVQLDLMEWPGSFRR